MNNNSLCLEEGKKYKFEPPLHAIGRPIHRTSYTTPLFLVFSEGTFECKTNREYHFLARVGNTEYSFRYSKKYMTTISEVRERPHLYIVK